MFFKFKRPKAISKPSRSPATPLKTTKKTKMSISSTSSISLKRFRWPSFAAGCSLRRKSRRASPAVSAAAAAVPLRRSPLPALPVAPVGYPTFDLPYRPPSRIRCGTSVIPLMRASRARLASATKRPATSMEHQLSKTPRLMPSEHYNPIYDEVYSGVEEDDFYEGDFVPKRKRHLHPTVTAPSLDLMQVSAMLEASVSPWKGVRPKSDWRMEEDGTEAGSDIYELHGGDWASISTTSGVYDQVASTPTSSVASVCSDLEEDENGDADETIYGWVPFVPPTPISWHSTAAYGAASTRITNATDDKSSSTQWLHRESYVVEP